MSLLDDVSIVVTPNGYKAGELYAVVPSSGAADMDVTRATAATRVDEAGLVKYAEIIGSEEVTNGDFATDSDWSKFDGTTISNSAINFNVTNTGTKANQTNVMISGLLYKVTFEILNYVGGNIYMSGWSIPLADRTEQSNGVFSFYAEASSSTFTIGTTSASTQLSIDNVSVKEVTRDNVPRIDYTGGGCPYILAEPQRTNKLTYSEDFSQWNKSTSITVEINNAISPSGDVNASLVTTASSNRFIYLSASSPANSTFSIYAKWKNGSGGIDLSTDGGSNYTSVSVTNDWLRVSVTPSTSAFQCVLRVPTGGSELYLWGAQLEAGYATSYIPTSGSAVTRNQDIFTRDGIGSLINSEEGVLFLESAALSNDGTNRFLFISDGTNDNGVRFFYSTTNNQIVSRYYVGGVATAIISFTLSDALNFNKIAFKWKENDFALWVNGVEVGTDSNGAVVSSDTLNNISLTTGVGSSPFFSKVKQLQVYKTALTDAQLTSLTS